MYGQFFVLFAIMFTGFFLRKIGLIDAAMNGGLNKFILFFSFPCLIIKNVGTLHMSGEILTIFIQMALLSFVVIFGGTFIARLYYRLRGYVLDEKVIFEFAVTAPNNGFLGFPIALLVYGQQGLLMMIATCFAFNVYCYGYGQNQYHRGACADGGCRSRKEIAVKTLLNPNIVGLAVGLAISMMGIAMPGPLVTFLDYMGGIATPMAMVYIGSSLADTEFFGMFREPKIWEASIIKLIVMPAITLGAVIFLPLMPMVKACLVLTMAFPTAALVSMLADMEGKDPEPAVRTLFMSTVFSMATLLMWIAVLSKTILQ